MQISSFTRVKPLSVAVTLVIATLIYSCKEKIPVASLPSDDSLPTQIVENMRVVQYRGGIVNYVVKAPLMESYSNAETPYDAFPEGIVLRGYTTEGMLETKIEADYARNVKREKEEIWEAFGNVVINNYLKGERMETDTLFWNRLTQRIYTHALVKLTTPDMFMQGYGMESDEMARNAVIDDPFNSYAIVSRDSTETGYIDTANFVGPLPLFKK